MKLSSKILEILVPCHLKIWSERLKFIYHVQLAVKTLKSETIITLIKNFFSDGKISEF